MNTFPVGVCVCLFASVCMCVCDFINISECATEKIRDRLKQPKVRKKKNQRFSDIALVYFWPSFRIVDSTVSFLFSFICKKWFKEKHSHILLITRLHDNALRWKIARLLYTSCFIWTFAHDFCLLLNKIQFELKEDLIF